MLDRLPPETFEDPAKTFLDPSCGNGQFLIEVLRRKLANLSPGDLPKDDETMMEKVFASVYGVDLMADNVCDTIARLRLAMKTGKDLWEENAQPKPELGHPGHSDDEDWQYLKDHRNDKVKYQRDYNGISVRFSHFNKGGAGVFEWSHDKESWTKCYNIVCCDGLKYDYEFDHEVPEQQEDLIKKLLGDF
jgi:hypothetical protein